MCLECQQKFLYHAKAKKRFYRSFLYVEKGMKKSLPKTFHVFQHLSTGEILIVVEKTVKNVCLFAVCVFRAAFFIFN
jgi:hypothetical protein